MSIDSSAAVLHSPTQISEERENSISRSETRITHAKSFSSSEIQDPRKIRLFSRGRTSVTVRDSPTAAPAGVCSSSAPPTRSASLHRQSGVGKINVKVPNGGDSTHSDIRCSPSSPSTLHRFRVWTSQHVPSKVYECVDALPQPLTMLTAPILQPPSVRNEDEESLRQYFSKCPTSALAGISGLKNTKDDHHAFEDKKSVTKPISKSDLVHPPSSQPSFGELQADLMTSDGKFKDTISLLVPFDSEDPAHLHLLEELWNEHHKVFLGRGGSGVNAPTSQNTSAGQFCLVEDRDIESATTSGSSHHMGTSEVTPRSNNNASQRPPRCPTPRLEVTKSWSWTPIAGINASTPISQRQSSLSIPPFQLIHHDWNSPIGFQQDNPTTDFRGGGILSLLVLLLYIIRFPDEWLMDLEQEKESGYFPAATSINVSFFLSSQCGLRCPSSSNSYGGGSTSNSTSSGGRGVVFRSLLARYRLVEYVLYGTIKKRSELEEKESKQKKKKKPKTRGCSESLDVADSEPVDTVNADVTTENGTPGDDTRREKRRTSSLSSFRRRGHSSRPSLTTEGTNRAPLPQATFSSREASFDGLPMHNSTMELESVEAMDHGGNLLYFGSSSEIQKDSVDYGPLNRMSKISASGTATDSGSSNSTSSTAPPFLLPPKSSCPCPLDRLVLLHTLYMRRVRLAWQRSESKNLMEFNTILKNVYEEMDKWWLRYGEHSSQSHNKTHTHGKNYAENEDTNKEKKKEA